MTSRSGGTCACERCLRRFRSRRNLTRWCVSTHRWGQSTRSGYGRTGCRRLVPQHAGSALLAARLRSCSSSSRPRRRSATASKAGLRGVRSLSRGPSTRSTCASFVSRMPTPTRDLRCEQTPFLSHFYISTITLPRQARDKHQETLQKEAFCAGQPWSDCRLVSSLDLQR
jgi:hypothetical protein